MGRVQQHARRQQRLEELSGAAVRALTGEPDLHVRARGLYRGQRRIPLHAPHLRTDPARDGLAAYRGAADGMALRLRHSDPELHRQSCPDAPIQRLVFELLEQLRVESLVPDYLPGVARNLADRFAAWSRDFHHAGLSDSALGILLYTLAQVCWSRLNARPVLDETEDLIEATRAGIVPLIGSDLAALKRDRLDQARFAHAALSIARTVDGLIGDSAPGPDDPTPDEDDEGAAAALKWLLDFDDGEDEGVATVTTGRSRLFEDAAIGYRVFTTAYDREVEARTLVRPALLRELRARLDERVLRQGVNVARLARQLAALFAQPARDGWLFGQEEGRIDGRRLAQLVSSPAERRLFRLERYQPRAHALVSMLIDCSGSMKGHVDAVAVLVDVLGRALQLAGVAVEVLGFTTGAWNGGRAQRDWLAQGRPPHPGRLNEATCMVFKDADTQWRRARPSIAAMLKPDLFREGIDGEAVEWACARMRGRDESRRVLVVISDGCPMDTATNLANDPFYLDNHLKDVVGRVERQGEIEIYGLGVGLDLSPYYSRCLALDLAQGLDNALFNEILQLLGGHHRR
jgi:cobaltochelatase CobT